MMDFEHAAQRLARDQSKMRGRRDLAVSQKAKRQAEMQRKQQARLRAERERQKRLAAYQQQYMINGNRTLRVKPLSSSSSSTSGDGHGLTLQATSIYGEGDKISLPPSVLEFLTVGDADDDNNVGNPWTFRIGILNPDYTFPASPLIKTLKPPTGVDFGDGDADADVSMVDSDDDDEDGGGGGDQMIPYMDELAHKYLSYTHCTVVEFTQEEGHVGIPQHIAEALLRPNDNDNDNSSVVIPTTRTVDPASRATQVSTEDDDDDNSENDNVMDTQPDIPTSEQTPGHLAWGAFDIPQLPLEITMVRLPKGKACTLVPTKEAVRSNFYGLKDVKLVLEQSLIRTRATLSVGDVVSTWHRGVKYDLNVTKVSPSAFNAVTCINTDIEVDIGETEEEEAQQQQQQKPKDEQKSMDTTNPQSSNFGTGAKLGTGYTLASSSPTSSSQTTTTTSTTPTANVQVLKPEPPADQKVDVCTVQIRFSGGNGKRRFHIHEATVNDLFAFATSLLAAATSTNNNGTAFRLVTRFPRRVFSLQDKNGSTKQTLAAAGIQAGQELFMVEME